MKDSVIRQGEPGTVERRTTRGGLPDMYFSNENRN